MSEKAGYFRPNLAGLSRAAATSLRPSLRPPFTPASGRLRDDTSSLARSVQMSTKIKQRETVSLAAFAKIWTCTCMSLVPGHSYWMEEEGEEGDTGTLLP